MPRLPSKECQYPYDYMIIIILTKSKLTNFLFVIFYLLVLTRIGFFLRGITLHSPVLLIMTIILVTVIWGLILSFFRKWLFLILLIIYVGGIMVLFSYIVALANNNKTFKINLKTFFLIRPLIFVPWTGVFHIEICHLSDLYSPLMFYIFSLFSIYLLFVLITVTKVSLGIRRGGIKSIFSDA